MAAHAPTLLLPSRNPNPWSFKLPPRTCAPLHHGASVRVSPWGSQSFHITPSVRAKPCLGKSQLTTAMVVEGVQSNSENAQMQLKNRAAELAPYLSGSSIFLVGMPRSGKVEVGRQLSEALGYYFFDSVQLVEAAAGDGMAQMLDEELQDAETEVLMQLSPLVRLVVATGERAVERPRNWGYLRNGITVWLDVPVDSLARGVGNSESVEELTRYLQERKEYYASADAVVSIERLAEKKNVEDISAITPAMVALQVLEEIDSVLKKSK